jgi:enoyl-CoA hydratase/carnithine racemase
MAEASDVFLHERRDHVAILTLNDPATRNALSGEGLFAAVETAAAAINADEGVRAVVLTGAGTAFCSGGNVRDMVERRGMFAGSPAEIAGRYRAGIQRVARAIYELDVPVIAAVNGPAIGAGCDLACLCDIRLASEHASFAVSFVKLGLIAGDGGLWLLPRIVGRSKAAELALTGDALDAQAALACGLVSAVVPADALFESALQMAGRIAANPPQAVRWTKRLLREADRVDFASMLDLAAAYQALAHHSEEHRQALAALREKPAGR